MTMQANPSTAQIANELQALRQENEQLRERVAANETQIDELETAVEKRDAEIAARRDEVDELRGRLDEGNAAATSNVDEGEPAASTSETDADGTGGGSHIEWRGDHKGVENLWIDDVPVGKILENRRGEIEELAADVEELRAGRLETDPEARVQDDYTPIERMAALGEDIADSITDRRALTLFENFTSWASRTPRGLVLKSGDDRVKTLLDTAREDDVIADWNQVYRAYDRLETLSGGYIEYREDRRHGKLLVLAEPMPSMGQENSAPTTSSVGA